MRSLIAALVALSLSPAISAADPFATRRPPPAAVIDEPAAAPEPRERIVVVNTPCNCEVDGDISRLTAARITGATGIALGLSVLALGVYERDRYNAANERGDYKTADEARDILRYGGTGMFVAGAVSLGVSVYLYATMPERRTIVAPMASRDQLGVALAHSF